MARKVLLLVSTILFSAAMTNGCAPDLTTTDPEEPWGGSGGSSSSSGDGGSNSSSSSSSGNSTSSSSGAMGSEDCLDGVDNDGDGNADCADSDCTVDYECTDAPPNGWLASLIEKGSGATPPVTQCADGLSAENFFTGMAGPAECSACMCGSLTGVQCNPPTLICHPGGVACQTANEDWTSAFGAVGSCVKPLGLLGSAVSLSCRIPNPATASQSGACPASAVDFSNKDTWSGWIHACTMKQAGSGCGTDQACVRKPTVESLCIGQPGQHVCPAGWPNQTEAYQSATDTRACTQCTCTPSPTCTGGSYRFYDQDSCDAGAEAPIDVTGTTCRDVSDLLDLGSWSIRYISAPTASGSCTAGGGMPTGSITPTGAMTFCCK